jgi:HD-GYP domain-containing protein (c-di-GMP phosphodiesterase class II)
MSDRLSVPEKMGHDFLKALHHLINTARNYQDNNQLIRNSVRKFHYILNELTAGGEISLRLWRSRFYLGGEKLPYRREAAGIANGMMEYFARRGIEALNFLESSRNASPDSILIFTRLFIEAARHENPQPWLEQKLDEENCFWVQVFRRQEDDTQDYGESQEEKRYQKARNTYYHAVETVKEVADKASRGMVGVRRSRRLAQNIVELVQEDEALMIGLTTIKEFDDYTYAHSVNVSLLSTCLGMHIGLSDIALEHLSICALFHDLGKVGVSKDILLKKGKLTDGEWDRMKAHPLIGVRKILMLNAAPSLRSRIILGPFEHHLNLDMTGYPNTMFVTHVSLMGKILHIADVYEALTAERNYRPMSYTPDEALKKMWEETGKSFDVILMKRFIKMMGAYPIGSVVQLNDDSYCLVMDYPDESERRLPLVLRLAKDEHGDWQRDKLIYLADQSSREGSERLKIIRSIPPAQLRVRPAEFFLHLK